MKNTGTKYENEYIKYNINKNIKVKYKIKQCII